MAMAEQVLNGAQSDRANAAQSGVGSLSEVLEAYLPIVRRVAYRSASVLGLPTGMDADDLVSHGLLG